jgi:hypothetical protein
MPNAPHDYVALALSAQLARAQSKARAPDSLHRRTTSVASKFQQFSGRPRALYTRTIQHIGQIRAEGSRDVNVAVAMVADAGPGGANFSAPHVTTLKH